MDDTIRPGDVVGLTKKTLKDKELRQLSPRRLHRIGWPNRFVVKKVFEDDEEGACIALIPCCGVLKRKSGDKYCGGHPQGLFEKLEFQKEPVQEEKPEASEAEAVPTREQILKRRVSVPGLGTVAGLEYEEGTPKGARLKGELAGVEGELTGWKAEIAKTLIQEFIGIL